MQSKGGNMIKVINVSASDLGVDDVFTIDPMNIPALMLHHRRAEVISAYCQVFGFTPEELAEYEGGIDEWIGFGSVTCYELGGGTLVGYGYNSIQMTIVLNKDVV
jgi:hypothetical protein